VTCDKCGGHKKPNSKNISKYILKTIPNKMRPSAPQSKYNNIKWRIGQCATSESTEEIKQQLFDNFTLPYG